MVDVSLIKKPIVTEKTRKLKDTQNTYAFYVDRRLTKSQIKNMIEEMFNVKVEKINTLILRGKHRRFGRFTGLRPTYKKVYAKLKKGYEIKLIEEVL